MTYDLDNFKLQWAERDRKLDTVIRLNRQLLSAMNLGPARSAVRWLTASVVIELVTTCATIALLGSFIADHVRALKFALPAVALDVVALALLQNLIRQIITARQIDYTGPITSIQKALARLRMLRIRYAQGLLLVAVLVWPPLLVVSFKAFFGLDAYSLFGAAYLWANVLLGFAVIALAIWLSKRFGDRLSGSPIVLYFARTISGKDLNAASDHLATLAAFENERLGG